MEPAAATRLSGSLQAGPGSLDQPGRLPLRVFLIDKYACQKKLLKKWQCARQCSFDLRLERVSRFASRLKPACASQWQFNVTGTLGTGMAVALAVCGRLARNVVGPHLRNSTVFDYHSDSEPG